MDYLYTFQPRYQKCSEDSNQAGQWPQVELEQWWFNCSTSLDVLVTFHSMYHDILLDWLLEFKCGRAWMIVLMGGQKGEAWGPWILSATRFNTLPPRLTSTWNCWGKVIDDMGSDIINMLMLSYCVTQPWAASDAAKGLMGSLKQIRLNLSGTRFSIFSSEWDSTSLNTNDAQFGSDAGLTVPA